MPQTVPVEPPSIVIPITLHVAEWAACDRLPDGRLLADATPKPGALAYEGPVLAMRPMPGIMVWGARTFTLYDADVPADGNARSARYVENLASAILPAEMFGKSVDELEVEAKALERSLTDEP